MAVLLLSFVHPFLCSRAPEELVRRLQNELLVVERLPRLHNPDDRRLDRVLPVLIDRRLCRVLLLLGDLGGDHRHLLYDGKRTDKHILRLEEEEESV